MNRTSPIEARLAELFAAYADRAPVDVDPIAMARVAAIGQSRRGWRWARIGRSDRGLAFIVIVTALLATIAAGALIAGAEPFRRDSEDLLTQRGFIEPFVGLPPEGVTPSTPETGELVLAFGGRVRSLGLDFHRVWVFADGRLIWKLNLDGVTDSPAFGGIEPTTAVIEQRLTREGVDLLRTEVVSSPTRLVEPTGTEPRSNLPGVLWGWLQVRDGERIVELDWSDARLPARLANPAAWLPSRAWEDRRIGAYVPSRYAVCLQHVVPEGSTWLAPTDIWDRLPEPTRTLIRSRAIEDPIPDWNEQDPRCLYQVSTDDARAITEAFEDAGLHREPGSPLTYTIPIGLPSRTGEGLVQLLVVLPNGEVVCHCG
jgi:hypothetical protein